MEKKKTNSPIFWEISLKQSNSADDKDESGPSVTEDKEVCVCVLEKVRDLGV